MISRRRLLMSIPCVGAANASSRGEVDRGYRSLLDFGVADDGHDALVKAIEFMQDNPGVKIRVPKGKYIIKGETIKIKNKVDFHLEGEAGVEFVVVDSDMSVYSDMDVRCKTLLSLDGGGSIYFKNIVFRSQKKSDVLMKIIEARCQLDSVFIGDCVFHGFTSVANLGIDILRDGVHPRSDAVTSIQKVSIVGNEVVSDEVSTRQCPKFFHIHCGKDILVSSNKIKGLGEGYLTRIVGGGYDTLPKPGAGSYNIRIVDNSYVTMGAVREYNQIAKSTGIFILNNAGDASRSPSPHNMFDCFNCFDVIFSGNSARGGGLLFFGHADLNKGRFPSGLRGAANCAARNNKSINPTHSCVFNIGGDGSSSGRRAAKNIVLEDNEVIIEPGWNKGRANYFLYTFVVNGLVARSNKVRGVLVWRSYYDSGVLFLNNDIDPSLRRASIKGRADYYSFDGDFSPEGNGSAGRERIVLRYASNGQLISAKLVSKKGERSYYEDFESGVKGGGEYFMPLSASSRFR